jgi:hypothetical protein
VQFAALSYSMLSNTLMPNSLSPSPSVRFETVMAQAKVLGFLKDALFPDFKKIFTRVRLNVEDTLNTVHMKLRTWLNISLVGTNDVRGKRRKSEDYFL